MKTALSLATLILATALAAPALAQTDDARTFAIGDFSAMALRDGTLSLPNDNKVFGVGQKPEEVAAVLSAAGLPADHLELSLQPLLVRTADRVMLFDTGAGGNMGATAGKLAASMAAAGVAPATVTDVFISHSHGDHVGGLLNATGALAFPNATIHISAPEWAFLKGMTAAQAQGAGVGQHAKLIAAITPKVAAFEPGADLIPEAVKAVDIKGHTPGHSGYMIRSKNKSVFYVGDTVHHFVVSTHKPEWTCGFDTDTATSQASRKAVLGAAAAKGQLIYAYHFPFPGVGKVKSQGTGFVWVPN
ncbi:MAG TPA: MBL fold metallo-hydrolase [Steroidobacteraceae bacterium]|nr:MBL fold metallo-hydrolase [Steroidobacteraceae bacterium]